MNYTIRRFALAVVTVPIALAVYGVLYFGVALIANSYVSVGLFTDNLTAVGFGWIVAVTFSKQIFDYVGREDN